MNILVTTCGGAAGVGALRLLSEYCECYSTDIDKNATGRIFSKDFRICSPVSSFENYSKDLQQMIQDWNIDYVIPILPEELEVIEKVVNQTKANILISPTETLSICCDKVKFYEWANKEVPEFVTKWQTLDTNSTLPGEITFLKPARGRGSKNCYKFNREELELFKKQIAKEELQNWINMEYLPGEEWTVDCYVRKHDKKIDFIVPRQRLQVLGGVCIKGKTEKNVQLIENTKKILNSLDFVGPICVQWKTDVNGKYKLLEINPRLSGGCLITSSVGADAMKCFLNDVNGIQEEVKWIESIVLGYNNYEILRG